MGVISHFYLIVRHTTEFAFLCDNSVVALFYFMEKLMKKRKITEEQLTQFISKMAEYVRDEMDYDFRVAQSQMGIAEKDLVNTFNDNQKMLYDDFCQKRAKFYQLASELYKRKI